MSRLYQSWPAAVWTGAKIEVFSGFCRRPTMGPVGAAAAGAVSSPPFRKPRSTRMLR
jgi:hypothetical protein